ncbi:unnamed protein product [Arabidopsis halleri]
MRKSRIMLLFLQELGYFSPTYESHEYSSFFWLIIKSIYRYIL